ncbi:MAG TPA: hypothetical protein DCO79_11860, partial [Spirochaeta sp.]|nr:hypothetical protein [Spirochaeta sp.]
FNSYDDFIIHEDVVWVPYEITELTEGFNSAWQTGIREWREAEDRDAAAIYPTHDAWRNYEPVGLPGDIQIDFPDDTAVRDEYEQEFQSLVDREIFQQVRTIEEKIVSKGKTARLLNRLGMLYAQYGLTQKAETNLVEVLSLDPDYLPALVNLGNIMLIKNNLIDALSYYEQASNIKPSNPSVLLGLARTHHELKNYGFVDTNYSKLKAVKPELALQFAYLDMQRSEETRAADISEMKIKMVWEEEEPPAE